MLFGIYLYSKLLLDIVTSIAFHLNKMYVDHVLICFATCPVADLGISGP